MRQIPYILFTLLLLVTGRSSAQNASSLIINVDPAQEILPPEVGDYKANPGKYFSVQLVNMTSEEQKIYLTIQIEQTADVEGKPMSLSLSSPPTRMPATPIVVPANGNIDLTMEQMRRLFDHVPMKEMQFDAGILDKFGGSDFGLLPEGLYRVLLTAYKWDPALMNLSTGKVDVPIALSNPTITGSAFFRVCYRAQAPTFTTPTALMGTASLYNYEAVKFPLMNPVFTWTEPTLNCVRDMVPMYQYTLTVREMYVMENIKQTPEQALNNPILFSVRNMVAPQCLLDYSALQKLLDGHLYIAQVEATPIGAVGMNYAMVENRGKSPIMVFTPQMTGGEVPEEDLPDWITEEEEEDDDSFDISMTGYQIEIGEDDSLYVFRNPKLTKPDFDGNTNHTLFAGNSLRSAWEPPVFVGGKGENPDSLKFHYKLQIFNLAGQESPETAMEQEPLCEWYAKGEGEVAPPLDSEKSFDLLLDTAPWEQLKSYVSVAQPLLLRVVPECVGAKSVRFYDDEINILPFMYSDKLSDAFGNACNSKGVIEENRVPCTLSEKEMRGKEIFVGEYIMTMGNDVKMDKKTKAWSGTGFMLWKPFGQNVKVGVKFDGIFINSNRIMYEGVVKSDTKSNWAHIKDRASAYAKEYTDTKEVGDWIPDDIFTDWGLDNLVGYNQPEELKLLLGYETNTLGKKVKASQYYDYVRKGYAVYDNFQKKGVGGFPDIEVFLPLEISDVYKTPVDVQIVSMVFYPTYAQMNLLGMFSLPDNDITEDNILMFGAPKVCMDPDRVLPGAGYVTLLSDVKLKDPDSSFDFTFKAPQNLQTPTDGCYVKWDNDTISALSLHANVAVPGLLATNSQGHVIAGKTPHIEVHGWVSDWSDWVASVSIDPFTHEDTKGWVFEVKKMSYDHSARRNPTGLAFPTSNGYKKEEAGIVNGDDNTWQGLYIEKVNLKFPGGFITKGSSTITGEKMLIDASGVTLSLNYNNAIDVDWGGWAMKMKKIYMNIVQNNFRDCGFSGSMHVPLMSQNMEFVGNMYPIEREDGSSDFDCILKVTNEDKLKNIHFDFMLAELDLNRKQTYFLLESRASRQSESDSRPKPRVELCLAGDITIGGTAQANDFIMSENNKLPLKLKIPGIHFTQMRLANCERWISDDKMPEGKEIAKMQTEATKAYNDTKLPMMTWVKLADNKTYSSASGDFYFETGAWSVASVEKNIGPFKLGIKGYSLNVDLDNNLFTTDITGRFALVDKDDKYDNDLKNALLCADITISIDATIDKKTHDFKYKATRFSEIYLNANFCLVKLEGRLKLGADPATKSKGFQGLVNVSLPGDLLTFEADGGFYEHSAGYKWGFFYLGAGGRMGVPITPLKVTKLGAGIYFNCHPTDGNKTKVTPKKGLIGVMADLGLASQDGALLSGDFHASVLYDKSRNRLTTFLFTGKATAVGGIVDSEVTMKWQNDNRDKYFQLTATLDVAADGSSIVNALGQTVGASEIARQMKLLNDKWEAAKGAVTGTLDKAMGDHSGATAGHQTGANVSDVKSEQSKGPKLGAHANLDLKLTFREGGKDLSSTKWHVYLGEPEEKKRCSFTLIDFNTKIVKVNIGANFYFCVGNELPNNGELPPIPTKIAQFLNGQSKGGMEGADMSKANAARKRSLSMFTADSENVGGGVMLGASAYGYVDVDLGIFYGSMGAIAGFDVTMAKLRYTDCPGYGQMGWNGWYAEGQLYAYLYAKFGIYVNLGFWDKRFDIIDAGIGGVLRCGLPRPAYFVGDARIKLKLLGGLVNINRRFQFECGKVCSVFYGNPLDNFELFGESTLGTTNVYDGWGKKTDVVDPGMQVKPVFATQAPIGEHFRVLDENTLHDLEKSYAGDVGDLEMQSKRTFVFRHACEKKQEAVPMLLEYATMPDTTNLTTDPHDFFKRLWSDRRVKVYYLTRKDVGQTSFRIEDLSKNLKENRYYALVVQGKAKEIVTGQEQDPLFYENGGWHRRAWTQTQIYYFRTGEANPEVEDVTDIDAYVALAYPTASGALKANVKEDVIDDWKDIAVTNSSKFLVYLEDARNPNVALSRQLYFYRGGRQYKKAGYPLQEPENLYWVFKSTNGKRSFLAPAEIVTNGNSQNIVLNHAYDFDIRYDNQGILGLLYKFYETKTRREQEVIGYTTRNVGGQTRTVPVTRMVVKTDSIPHYKVLMGFQINPQRETWMTGHTSSASTYQLIYSKPFVGTRLDRIKTDYTSTNFISRDWDMVHSSTHRLYDPYLYLSYLANFVFVGGHPIKAYGFDYLYVPVSESLIYKTKAGQRSGNYVASKLNNIKDGWNGMRTMSLYLPGSYKPAFGNYPLPAFDKASFNPPLISASQRTAHFVCGSNDQTRLQNVLGDIASTYYLAEKASDMLIHIRKTNGAAKQWLKSPSSWQTVWNFKDMDANSFKAFMKQRNDLYRGAYHTESYKRKTSTGWDEVSIQVPWYQFPLTFGATFNHAGNTANMVLQESMPSIGKCDRESSGLSGLVFYRLAGGSSGTYTYNKKTKTLTVTSLSYNNNGREYFDAQNAMKHISEVQASYYRVNAFDWGTGQYFVIPSLGGLTNNEKTVTIKNPLKSWKNDGN